MAQRYGRLSALRSQIRKADFIQIIHQGVTKPSRGDFSVSNLYEFTGTLKDLTVETGRLSCVDYDSCPLSKVTRNALARGSSLPRLRSRHTMSRAPAKIGCYLRNSCGIIPQCSFRTIFIQEREQKALSHDRQRLCPLLCPPNESPVSLDLHIPRNIAS